MGKGATRVSRPVIGVTSYGRDAMGRLYVPGDYLAAVHLSGGIPVVLVAEGPADPELLQRVDGLVLVGGGDVAPERYGGPWHPTLSGVDPERDEFELELVRLAIDAGLPLLGICRGVQVMNVALGGDLIPHIPDEYGVRVPHDRGPGPRALHRVRIVPGTRLHRILGVEELYVRSRHHQAVRHPGHGLAVSATAADGVIEALEWTDPAHPFAIGVQWHPEDGLAADPLQQSLFTALVEAAARIRVVSSEDAGESGKLDSA